MPLKLYCNDMSAPVRAVLMTARALGVEMQLEEINIYNKEQFSEEYIQMNPQHTIPTLVDEDFVLCDSHAIVGYLVAKYAEDDGLYPKDPKKRALVDQRMYFDSGTLYPRVNDVMHSIVVENEKEIPTEKISAITDSYRLLDIFLKDRSYIAGDEMSVADFCCAATVSTATIVTPISKERYPQLSSWYRRIKGLPLYEETNAAGLNRLDALVETKLGRPTAREQGE